MYAANVCELVVDGLSALNKSYHSPHIAQLKLLEFLNLKFRYQNFILSVKLQLDFIYPTPPNPFEIDYRQCLLTVFANYNLDNSQSEHQTMAIVSRIDMNRHPGHGPMPFRLSNKLIYFKSFLFLQV
jgi:hypothetical protein